MQRFYLWMLLALFWGQGNAQATYSYTPVFKPSDQSLFNIKADQVYTFGYLEVPENREDPTSRKIQLPVYIFKSRSTNPKKDPIIYTVGGPGSSTMPSAQYMAYYQYLDDRDFILFEQRGTQYAQPHLACPEWSRAIHQINLPEFDSNLQEKVLLSAADSCKRRLEAANIDLNGYHTRETAADIEDLRKVLGIEKYNLLTISYSTKIAQVLMRDFPEGIRSVVMDSALPLEVNYDEESVANLFEAMDKLFADCARDDQCKQAFPDLRDRFYRFLAEKSAHPLELTLDNPINGSLDTFTLKGSDLVSAFSGFGTPNVGLIPFEMEKLMKGDWSTVLEQLKYAYSEPGNGAGIGMRLSVWCAEEFPFVDQAIVKKETNHYPETIGLSPAVYGSTICDLWGVKAQSQAENEPIKSDIPVLLTNGSYDNETPPEWAAAMQENLPNSFHIVFPGWKHTVTTNWGNPCAMAVANAFFNDPSTKPALECLEAIVRPSFKTE